MNTYLFLILVESVLNFMWPKIIFYFALPDVPRVWYIYLTHSNIFTKGMKQTVADNNRFCFSPITPSVIPGPSPSFNLMIFPARDFFHTKLPVPIPLLISFYFSKMFIFCSITTYGVTKARAPFLWWTLTFLSLRFCFNPGSQDSALPLYKPDVLISLSELSPVHSHLTPQVPISSPRFPFEPYLYLFLLSLNSY